MDSSQTNQLTWRSIPHVEDQYDHTSTLYKHYIISFGGIESYGEAFVKHISILNLKTYETKQIKLKEDDQKASQRFGHTACLLGEDQIVIFGGQSWQNILSDTAVIDIKYDPTNDSISLEWRMLPTKGAENLFRSRHIAHIYRHQMFVFGGANEHFLPSNELWSLNFHTLTWTQCKLTKDILGGLMGHSSVHYNDQIFVFGGRTDDLVGTFTNEFWTLDLKKMEWSLLKTTRETPPPRIYSAMQENNGKIYFLGGNLKHQDCSSELFSYDIERNTWQKIVTNGNIAPRFGHTLNSYENLLIVIGGSYDSKPGQVLPEYCHYLPIAIKYEETEIYKGETESQVLKTLFKDKSMADVRFVIQGQEVKAHKAILAAGCNFFKNMFTSGMIESQSNVIEINDVKMATFNALVEFIYCNEVILNEDLAYDLLDLPNKYAFKELRKGCELFLSKRIRQENYAKLAEIANLLQLQTLEDSLKKYIKLYPNI